MQLWVARADDNVADVCCCRVSDVGGGIPANEVAHVWQYMYSTADESSELAGQQSSVLADNGVDRFVSCLSRPAAGPMAGFGYGLSTSRAFARYLGGDLAMQSMFGHGTDMFLHLKHFDSPNANILLWLSPAQIYTTSSVQSLFLIKITLMKIAVWKFNHPLIWKHCSFPHCILLVNKSCVDAELQLAVIILLVFTNCWHPSSTCTYFASCTRCFCLLDYFHTYHDVTCTSYQMPSISHLFFPLEECLDFFCLVVWFGVLAGYCLQRKQRPGYVTLNVTPTAFVVCECWVPVATKLVELKTLVIRFLSPPEHARLSSKQTCPVFLNSVLSQWECELGKPRTVVNKRQAWWPPAGVGRYIIHKEAVKQKNL